MGGRWRPQRRAVRAQRPPDGGAELRASIPGLTGRRRLFTSRRAWQRVLSLHAPAEGGRAAAKHARRTRMEYPDRGIVAGECPCDDSAADGSCGGSCGRAPCGTASWGPSCVWTRGWVACSCGACASRRRVMLMVPGGTLRIAPARAPAGGRAHWLPPRHCALNVPPAPSPRRVSPRGRLPGPKIRRVTSTPPRSPPRDAHAAPPLR